MVKGRFVYTEPSDPYSQSPYYLALYYTEVCRIGEIGFDHKRLAGSDYHLHHYLAILGGANLGHRSQINTRIAIDEVFAIR